MQLSILIPTHRSDLLACSRIAQACSWAGPQIEVVVRDNSGQTDKRRLLEQFRRDHCTIVFAEECPAMMNFEETLKLARGEFILFLADDDFAFDRAIAALPAAIDGIKDDPAVAALAGSYLIEASKGSALVAYKAIDADDVAARVTGYLAFEGANVLAYAPVRRAVLTRVHAFINAMPMAFSFHDQIMCLLYLLNGKFVSLKRLLYLYDVGEWELPQTAQQRDLAFYRSSGADPAINKLHWFLCGFEGAMLARNATGVFPDHPMAARQAVADRWFSVMYQRFLKNPRADFGSPLAPQANAFCEKWKSSAGKLSFNEMLADICRFIGLFSQDKAHAYAAFWSAVMTRTTAPRG